MTSNPRLGSGIAFASAAYLTWAVAPVYWHQLDDLPSLQILSHRVVWSFAFLAVLLTAQRRWGEFGRTLTSYRTLVPRIATSILIVGNWFLFIWAVNSGHITQVSLGYYITPLVNVLVARIFLGERVRRLQLAAVLIACAGVINLAAGQGAFPWVSVALAVPFSLYGLVGKMAPVEPLTGVALEMALATPACLGILFWLGGQGAPALGTSHVEAALLLGSGVITAIPLLCFGLGAKRLKYTTIGILQYGTPTGQLALAVLLYGEPFTDRHALTFALIWVAVILYAVDGVRVASRSLVPLGNQADQG